MMRPWSWVFLVVAYFITAQPVLASAQGKGAVELGFDGGVSYVVRLGENALTVDLPVQSVRAGLYLSDQVEVESSLRFHVTAGAIETFDSLDLGAGVLVHFGDTPKRAPFLLAGLEWRRLDSGFPDATKAVTLAFGYKLPVAERWGVRLQLEANRLDGSFSEEYWELGPRFGISVFTK